jgi:D-alanyl-D-alanine carboxypeptidase
MKRFTFLLSFNLLFFLLFVTHLRAQQNVLQTSSAQSSKTNTSNTSPAAFNQFITDYIKSHNFNGTILVQQNGKKIYNQSFGFANFQFNIPNTNETKYKIASITKLFTSVLIMQLVEQGKIDLNQNIKTYLPDYKGKGAENVTIFDLLTATSGIESNEKDVKGDDIPAMYAKPYSTDELLNLFCSGKLENEPGKVWNYNNADYVILGKIIEAICNKPYEDFLKEKICEPLKMANTGMFSMTKVIKNLANVYEVNDSTKTIENTPPIYTQNYYAAGGLYSTANDLLKFSNALYGCRLINSNSLKSILQPYLATYGFGIWVYDMKVNKQQFRIAERQGAIWGTKTRLLHIFDKDITIILLTNAQTTSIDDLQAKIIAELLK